MTLGHVHANHQTIDAVSSHYIHTQTHTQGLGSMLQTGPIPSSSASQTPPTLWAGQSTGGGLVATDQVDGNVGSSVGISIGASGRVDSGDENVVLLYV